MKHSSIKEKCGARRIKRGRRGEHGGTQKDVFV
jgi:hypothetical protein